MAIWVAIETSGALAASGAGRQEIWPPDFDNTTSQVLPGFHIHRLSIRPYPAELERVVRLSDGTPMRLPPNRPEVEAVQQRAFGQLSGNDP